MFQLVGYTEVVLSPCCLTDINLKISNSYFRSEQMLFLVCMTTAYRNVMESNRPWDKQNKFLGHFFSLHSNVTMKLMYIVFKIHSVNKRVSKCIGKRSRCWEIKRCLYREREKKLILHSVWYACAKSMSYGISKDIFILM